MAAKYFCQNRRRRAQVLAAVGPGGAPVLNGIDYLEVAANQTTLSVHFLFDLPGASNAVPPAPAPQLAAANIVIDGGVRITGVVANSVSTSANILTVNVDASGDFSTYTLRLVAGSGTSVPPTGFDPRLAAVDFSFKVGCPSDFDCQTISVCPPAILPEPDINYLAKDYQSFRRLILDRMAVTMPAWTETSPADAGVALAELLAYAGDQLSYYQDAVATEAYLGTARRRISVRRHARLLDYAMHDGCNSRAWVFIGASGSGGVIPAGTTLLTRANAAGPIIAQDQVEAALLQGSQAFQTLTGIAINPALNQINFYTWSDDLCCLSKGATEATLADNGAGALLKVGDLLLFEEVLGPATGAPADADPAHRQVVRLTQVAPGQDPLNGTAIVEIAWAAADALAFPLCLSSVIQGAIQEIANVSVARGNVVVADNGLTQPAEDLPAIQPDQYLYRPRLQSPGLTFAVPYDDIQARQQPAAGLLIQDVHQALPDISLEEGTNPWTPRRDLLSSVSNATDFVVEMDDNGIATLRFGDGVFGAEPPVSGLVATYRTGNGTSGNVGAESIAHAVAAPLLPGIAQVRNPLPAQGGVDPESLDDVRNFAPSAFRTQERAVTEDDYSVVTCRQPQVKQARATLRWTGSWYTMFITVERNDAQPVDEAFRTTIRDFLEQFRLAGYDLEIEGPLFVPLDILFTICVAPGYFRTEVEAALLNVFSNRILPDGTRGFFYPDNFIFGQPVYLSQVVATAMQVPGVAWVDTSDAPGKPNRFQRWGQASYGEIAAGRIPMDRLEIARLDNDPSLPENGQIQFLMEGGV